MPFHVLDTLSRFDLLTCISRSVCANRQYQGRLSEIIDLRSLMDTALFYGCSLFFCLVHSFFCGELLRAKVSARKVLVYSLVHSAAFSSCGCAATWRSVRTMMGAECLALNGQTRNWHVWKGEGRAQTHFCITTNSSWGSSIIIFEAIISINNALN